VVTTDLYSVDLRSISGTDLYRAISEFIRVDLTLDDRPREGYLLDFKEELSDRFLRSVAAFANTFGGLLIVGVSEEDGRPSKIVGVATNGELKTRVASVIASNLFPCPLFEVAECIVPSDADGKKLCVLRVHETNEICLLAKKGESYPVYVRIEDQSRPADASQLRVLLSRKAQSQNLVADLDGRIRGLSESLRVLKYQPNILGARSPTFLKIILCPYTHPLMQLDRVTEALFGSQMSDLWPGLQQLLNMHEAKVDLSRSRDWYEIAFLDQAHDYERRWRVTNRSDIGFITQVRWSIASSGDFWSLFDVVADLINVCKLARQFWRQAGYYYGGFRLVAQLNVEGLRFEVDEGAFEPFFYQRLSGLPDFSLDSRAVKLATNWSSLPQVAQSEMDLDYASLADSLSETVAANIVNQLLRSLGYLADSKALQQSIRLLFFQTI